MAAMSATDLLPQTDSLGAQPSILPTQTGLDASAIDRNLRAVRHVQSVWSLPELPDEVQLDLASIPELQHENLQHFLYGIESDLRGSSTSTPIAPETPRLTVQSSVGQFGPLATSGFDQANAALASLRSLPAHEVLDADATQRWKMRAIEKGFLDAPADGVVDSTWSPELSSIQRRMQYDTYNDKLRGDRFGAMPLSGKHGLIETLYDWTSPSGLMRAAVDLDLFWDFGNISKELDSWGDKWRKVGKSKNPLDFGKNLFDALTGPIDDIVVPVINMALLWTGLGVGANFAKLGATGLTALEGAETLSYASKLYEVPKLGTLVSRIMPGTLEVGKLGEASWTAEKLMKGGETAQKIGGAMERWRALPGVIGTRGVVQTGMRLGLVSQAEHRLLPGYQGGVNLGDVPAVASAADTVLRNSWVATIGEPLFAPFTIFNQGTFTSSMKDSGLWVVNRLGSTWGRAAAGAVAGAGAAAILGDGSATDTLTGMAAGAVAGAAAPMLGKGLEAVGGFTWRGKHIPIVSHLDGVGRVMQLSDWSVVSKDQKLTELMMRSVKQNLSEEDWGKFTQRMDELGGFIPAFSEKIGATSHEEAGAMMAFLTVSASIDRTAALQAGRTGAFEDLGWWQRYLLARNKLQAQVRFFGENPNPDEVIHAIVSKEANSTKRLARRFRDYQRRLGEDPEAFAAALQRHNDQAQLTLRQLLSPDNLPIDGLDTVSRANMAGLFGAGASEAGLDPLVEYISNAFDTFGNWGAYHGAMNGLNTHVANGLFDDMQLRPVFSNMGREAKISFRDVMPEFVTGEQDDEIAHIVTHLHDNIFTDATTAQRVHDSGFYYNPLAREINPWRSRVTLMKRESVTKQQLMVAADELRRTEDGYKALAQAAKVKLGDTALIYSDGFVDMSTAELNQMLRDIGENRSNAGKAVRRVHQLATHAKGQGADMAGSLDAVLRQYVTDLDTDAKWMRFGQGRAMTKKDGSVLSGLEALAARRNDLIARANRTAAEVDVDHLLEQIAAKGGMDSGAYRQMEAYFNHVESQGYRVVYGHDFLMPNDLHFGSGLFEDINTKHLNAVTLGNFFGKRHPAELAMNVQQARSRAIANELAKVWGENVMPDDPRIHDAITDLYRLVLDPERQQNIYMLSDTRHQSMIDKLFTAGRTSGQARDLQSLGLAKHSDKVIEALSKTRWSREEAKAIYVGLRRGRYAEWSDQGLYAIEAKLRGRNQVLDLLHVLGGTENASRLRRALPGAIAGGFVGSQFGRSQADQGESGRTQALLGMLGGAVVGGLAGTAAGVVAQKLESAIDMATWTKYGHLADSLAAVRDRMRFSLSPFFDASRYTEAFMLGQTAAPKRLEDGSRMVLPLNQSPKALRKSFIKQALGEGLSEGEAITAANNRMERLAQSWSAASKGRFDVNKLEDTQRQFEEIGMLGFNPTRWMMSTFHHLQEQGMEASKAYEAVRDMYTYGVRSRSAFEQSVNFVFFPFSFQKKVLHHAADWLSDDMVRSVLLHDAYKAYQLLDEHFDVGQWAKEHLPVLDRLQQLNAFAFGVSPGKLGGVNAPFVDVAIGDPLSPDPNERGKGLLFNLLSPIGVNIGQGVSSDELTTLMRKTVPAINDVRYMIDNLKEQGHVLFDPTHKTTAAQARDGFEQWSEFRKGIEAAMKDAGASWYDLYNNPGMAPLLAQYQQKKNELEAKYPGWVEAKLRAMGNTAELEQERQHRINTVQYNPEDATASDVQFAQFESMLAEYKAVLSQYGITDWQEMAPADFARIKGVAIEMARTNPGFRLIYQKFYEKAFGPITSEVL